MPSSSSLSYTTSHLCSLFSHPVGFVIYVASGSSANPLHVDHGSLPRSFLWFFFRTGGSQASLNPATAFVAPPLSNIHPQKFNLQHHLRTSTNCQSRGWRYSALILSDMIWHDNLDLTYPTRWPTNESFTLLNAIATRYSVLCFSQRLLWGTILQSAIYLRRNPRGAAHATKLPCVVFCP